MLTLAQLKYISESVDALLAPAVETLLEKAGSGHESDVAQLLLNITSTFSYIRISTVLKNVQDSELKSAIEHIYHCLKPSGLGDMTARQIVRQFLGQDEETAAIQQLVANMASQCLLKRAVALDEIKSKETTVVALSADFKRLLENTSTEDADQKKKRRARLEPESSPAIVTLSEPVRRAPVIPQRLTQPTRVPPQVTEVTAVLPEEPIRRPAPARVVPQHQETELEQRSLDFMRRPGVQTHAIPVFNAQGLFPHRRDLREATPQESYRVFFVGRRASLYAGKVSESLRDPSRLKIEIIPNTPQGLQKLRNAGHYDALVICDYGLGNAVGLCEKYQNTGIPGHKICLMLPIPVHNLGADFKVISPAYDERLLSHLRSLSAATTANTLRM